MGAAAGDDKFYNGLVPASDWNRGPPHLPSHGSRGGKEDIHPWVAIWSSTPHDTAHNWKRNYLGGSGEVTI